MALEKGQVWFDDRGCSYTITHIDDLTTGFVQVAIEHKSGCPGYVYPFLPVAYQLSPEIFGTELSRQ